MLNTPSVINVGREIYLKINPRLKKTLWHCASAGIVPSCSFVLFICFLTANLIMRAEFFMTKASPPCCLHVNWPHFLAVFSPHQQINVAYLIYIDFYMYYITNLQAKSNS